MAKREDMADIPPDNVKITEDDLTVLAMHALIAARDAFNEYIAWNGTDPAYFDIRFMAWQLAADNFERFARVELEQEVKDKNVNP